MTSVTSMPGSLDPTMLHGSVAEGDSYLDEVKRTLDSVQMGLETEKIARQEAEARCRRLEEQLSQLHGFQRAASATPRARSASSAEEQPRHFNDPFAAIGTPAAAGTPFAPSRPGGVALSDSLDLPATPTPALARAPDAHEAHRQRRHASFQEPMTAFKPTAPRRSEMPNVPMFEHHAPEGFDFRATTPSETKTLSEVRPVSVDDYTGLRSGAYANMPRIRRAAEQAILLGSPQSIELAKTRKAYGDVKGPKRPYPQEYEGSTDPLTLHHWTTRVNLWFNGERISPNSIEGTSFLANFFEKSSKAASWFSSTVLDDLADYIRYMEAKGLAVDPASPSPWPFDDIIVGLKAKFISKTFSRDVEYKFNNLKQVSDGVRMNVDELADKIWEVGKQMNECSTKQMKQRLLDALEVRIAAEVNKDLDYEDTKVSFQDLREKAVKIETGMLAARAAAILRKNGQNLPNSAALSASAALDIIKDDESKAKKASRAGSGGNGGSHKTQAPQAEKRQLANMEGKSFNKGAPRSAPGGVKRKEDENKCWNCGKEGCRKYRCPSLVKSGKPQSKTVSSVERDSSEGNRGERLLYAYETLCPDLSPDEHSALEESLDRVLELSAQPGRSAEADAVLEHHAQKVEEALAEAGSYKARSFDWAADESDENDLDDTVKYCRAAEMREADGLFIRAPLVCGDVSLDAVFDTAASHCFISPEGARVAKAEIREYENPVQVRLAVAGSKANINRYAKLSFDLDGETHHWSFDIVPLKGKDTIIGMDLMRAKQAILTCMPPSVTLGGRDLLPERVLEAIAASETDVPLPADWPSDKEIEDFREDMLTKYPAAFISGDEPLELPPFREVQHAVPLKDPDYKQRQVVYPVAEKYIPSFSKLFNERVEAGIWVPMPAQNASPMMVLGKKASDDIRVVVNTRERNKNTHKQVSPVPRVDQMTNQFARRPYRTKFDVKGAFEQIRVKEEDVPNNTISTIYGTVASRVAIQGDLNSPNTCQRMMSHIYRKELADGSLLIYMDDLFVGSDSWEQHKADVEEVLKTTVENQLKLSRQKWELLPRNLSMLGRRLDMEGLYLDPTHVDALLKFPPPKNRKQCEQWCGLLAWCDLDLPDVAKINAPISALKGKGEFRWSSACEAAFKELKDLISDSVCTNQKRVALDPKDIAHPDTRPVHLSRRPDKMEDAPKNEHPGKHLFLATDASAEGIGGGLFVGENWWNAKPLGFFSRRYKDAQYNYPVHEQEMLGVIEGLKKFSLLVEGQQVTVLTDNKALTTDYPRDPSKRMSRWLEKLADFDVDVKHIEGATNGLADAMSRVSLARYLARVPETDNGEDCCPVLQSYDRLAQTLEELSSDEDVDLTDDMPPLELRIPEAGDVESSSGETDPDMPPGIPLKSLAATTRSGQTRQQPVAPEPKRRGPTKAKKRTKQELKAMRVFLDRAPESWATPDQHQLALDAQHQDDLVRCIGSHYGSDPLFSKFYEPDGTDGKEEAHTDFFHKPVVLGDDTRVMLLYHRHDGCLRLCLPKALFRERSIREIFLEHVHTVLGHFGHDKMMGMLSKSYWWPGMSKECKAYCDSCPSCQACKPNTGKPVGLVHSPSLPPHPWHTVGIDFIGPLPTSQLLGATFDFLLVVIDHFSGEVQLIPTQTAVTGEELAEIWIAKVYPQHGLPRNIVSDRDVRFTGAFWQVMHAKFGTTLSMSSSYHPQSNGKTERMNRSINAVMRQLVDEYQTNWASQVAHVEFAVNSSKSESTGYAPFELTRGYLPATVAELVGPRDDFASETDLDEATRFVVRAQRNQAAALDLLISSRVMRNASENLKRRDTGGRYGPEKFDKVWLSTKNLSIIPQRARKFVPKFTGPFRVLRTFPQTDSYELDIPERYSRRGLHNKFHSSLLRPFVESDEKLFPNRVVDSVPVFPLDEMDQDWTLAFNNLESGDPFSAVNGSTETTPHSEREESTASGIFSPPAERAPATQEQIAQVKAAIGGSDTEMGNSDKSKDKNEEPVPAATKFHVAQVMISGTKAAQIDHLRKQVDDGLVLGPILDHYKVNDGIIELKLGQGKGKPAIWVRDSPVTFEVLTNNYESALCKKVDEARTSYMAMIHRHYGEEIGWDTLTNEMNKVRGKTPLEVSGTADSLKELAALQAGHREEADSRCQLQGQGIGLPGEAAKEKGLQQASLRPSVEVGVGAAQGGGCRT